MLGTDKEGEDVEGSVSVTRREKVGQTEDIGDKATLKHLCYLIVHGTTQISAKSHFLPLS